LSQQWRCERGRLDPSPASSFLDIRAHDVKAALEDFKAERLLRPEMVDERPLRHLRGLDDVADAGASVPLFEHHLQTGRQQFFAVRWLRHTGNIGVRISKASPERTIMKTDTSERQ
jgi:hypothetical protein